MSDLSPETRALIASLRDADRPTDADRTRNRGELSSRLGIGVVAASGAIAAAKTATASTAASIGAAGGTKVGLGGLGGLSLTMKIAGAAVVASGVAASTAAVIHETREPEPVVVSSSSRNVGPVTASKGRPSTRPSTGGAIEVKTANEADEAPVPVAPDETSEPVAAVPAFEAPPARAVPERLAASPPPLSPPPSPRSIERPAPAGEIRTGETAAREASKKDIASKDIASKAPADPRPSENAPPETPPPPRTDTTVAPTARESVPSAETTLAAETSLLRRAQSALVSGEASRALALLDEHSRKFPRGVLTEERDAERVTAICASGQAERARAEAARFIAAHPNSPMTARVRRTCEAR